MLTSLAIGNLGNGSTCRESYGDGVEVNEAASISVDRPLAVFSPLPPCLGLLPQSLAFLLFWFNKTKSGALAARVRGELPGHTLIATQNHHPQVPEPSSSWGSHFNTGLGFYATHCPPKSTALLSFPWPRRPEGDWFPNGAAGIWAPEGFFCPSLPVLSAEP